LEKEKKLEMERQKREKQRLKKEEERRAKEEERRVKEEEKKRRIREEKKRKEEKERLEKERLENERLEKERLEKERLEKELVEKERLEKELLEKNRLEKERIEKERLEKKRLEMERLEKERLEKERLEKEWVEKEAMLAKEKTQVQENAHVPEPIAKNTDHDNFEYPRNDAKPSPERQQVLMEALMGPRMAPAFVPPSNTGMPRLPDIYAPPLLGRNDPFMSPLEPMRQNSISPIGLPINGRRVSSTVAGPIGSVPQEVDPFLPSVIQRPSTSESGPKSFFTNHLFGERVPNGYDKRYSELEHRSSTDANCPNWTNGWIASSVFSDHVHGKLFGDALVSLVFLFLLA
jgi:hypothetical protein